MKKKILGLFLMSPVMISLIWLISDWCKTDPRECGLMGYIAFAGLSFIVGLILFLFG